MQTSQTRNKEEVERSDEEENAVSADLYVCCGRSIGSEDTVTNV